MNKKAWQRIIHFAWTVFTSALNEYLITGSIRWRAAWGIVSYLLYARRTKIDRRPGSSWHKRIKACSKCELYDEKRRACGARGIKYQRGGAELPLGCGCWLPAKASIPEAQCWLYEETGGQFGHDWGRL